MRIYKDKETWESELEQVICNQCGKRLKVEDGIVKEGCFSSEYAFDYFSEKDGYIYSLDLCEACFDTWIKGFKEPVRVTDTREFL